MFELFETVKIKKNGVIGTIVDKTVIKGKTNYVVESDTYVNPGKKPYGGDWPLYDCAEEELTPIHPKEDSEPIYKEAVAM